MPLRPAKSNLRLASSFAGLEIQSAKLEDCVRELQGDVGEERAIQVLDSIDEAFTTLRTANASPNEATPHAGGTK